MFCSSGPIPGMILSGWQKRAVSVRPTSDLVTWALRSGSRKLPIPPKAWLDSSRKLSSVVESHPFPGRCIHIQALKLSASLAVFAVSFYERRDRRRSVYARNSVDYKETNRPLSLSWTATVCPRIKKTNQDFCCIKSTEK